MLKITCWLIKTCSLPLQDVFDFYELDLNDKVTPAASESLTSICFIQPAKQMKDLKQSLKLKNP